MAWHLGTRWPGASLPFGNACPLCPGPGRQVFLGPGVIDRLEVSQALLSSRSPTSVWQEGPAWGPLGDSDPSWMKEDTCSFPRWPGSLCIFTLRGNLSP